MESRKTTTVNLSRAMIYEGKKFGPGEVTNALTKIQQDPITGEKKRVFVLDLMAEKDQRITARDEEKKKREMELRMAISPELAPKPGGLLQLSQDDLNRLIKEGVEQALAQQSAERLEQMSVDNPKLPVAPISDADKGSAGTEEDEDEGEDEDEDEDEDEGEQKPATSDEKKTGENKPKSTAVVPPKVK